MCFELILGTQSEDQWGRHSEDMDLHSVNYLHYGAPKYWYCIPPEHRERFERWVKDQVPDCFRGCSEFIRHKVRSTSWACKHGPRTKPIGSRRQPLDVNWSEGQTSVRF